MSIFKSALPWFAGPMRWVLPILVLVAAVSPGGPLMAESNIRDPVWIYHAIQDGRLPLISGQPIYIRSETGDDYLRADVYSIVHYPLAELSRVLTKPQNWCDFLTLHLNVKACTYRPDPDAVLSVYAGRKFYQPPEAAFRLDYHFQVIEQSSRRLAILLTAEKGQLSTRNYRIRLEAEVMNPRDMLLHFSLFYRRSLASRMATRAYLSTLGSDKVGFSRKQNTTGEKNYIKGVGGIIERNAMRYFLALSVYMDTLNTDSEHPEYSRSRRWFEMTERYHRQLHELDRTEYLIAKKQEFENQKNLQYQIDGGILSNKQPDDQ